MKQKHIILLAALLIAASCNSQNAPAQPGNTAPVSQEQTGQQTARSSAGQNDTMPQQQHNTQAANNSSSSSPVTSNQSSQSQAQNADPLANLGSSAYISGNNLPLGDYKYTTTGPKKGYVYLCHAQTGGGGAQANGSWIHGSSWNISEKTSVQGSVSWPQAHISITTSGSNRVITTNDLPTDHTSGTFPIQSSDPAYQIDRNPNTITTQNFTFTLPVNPTLLSSPACMGGEVGVMTDGVVLFNAFDAEGRDAAAHEVQDKCDAHPQESGIYHYHSLSRCITNISVENVIGYAFDGLPITGPEISSSRYLTTNDLDECHGITSEIVLDGEKVTTYHYVMTEDFPYSVSCFRARNTQNGPLGGSQQTQSSQQPPQGQQGMMPPPPPQW